MWTRRDLLRAVGAGASALALAPLGCATTPPPVHATPEIDADRLRDALRAAVEVVGARLATPVAFATVRRRLRAVVDLDQRGLAVEQRMLALVGGRDRLGRWHERGTDDLSPASVAALASELATGPADGPGARAAVARTVRDHVAIGRDPRAVARRTWLEQADALARRVAAHASSRIVYRAAWLVSDDDETWIIGTGVDHRQRVVRGAVGAAMVTWHGRRPVAGEATTAGRWVPEAEQLTDDALARAADDALTLFTPGGAPEGETTVVLAPDVVAAILDRLLARPALAATITPAPNLTLVDDPTAAAALAGYVVDDDGRLATPITLYAGGHAVTDLTRWPAGARRAGPWWQRTRGPCHLDLAAGPTAVAALEAGVERGLVLDGLGPLHLDDDGRLVARIARCRELARGQRTGRLWGDLELRADVGALLAGVRAVSAERAAIAIADDGPPRGALVPWLVGRAEVTGGGWT